ncbi:hypothetical protein ACTPOE_16165 [Castellaniella sp. WN]
MPKFEIFRQFRQVFLSAFYGIIDEISSWWSYRVARSVWHLENRNLSRQRPPRDETEAQDQYDGLYVLDVNVSYHETRHIERLCIKYGVSLPDKCSDEMVVLFEEPGIRVFTQEGKNRLLHEIAIARKERLENFRSWVYAFSGLLGILIAFISFLMGAFG